jgi:rfaE bifunctional protein kinase chain/domain
MNINKITDILDKASGKTICIIGDVMLDRYLLGEVTRISPEAPVQVFETLKSEPKLGGAANVCLNIKKLDANPYLIGVYGNDREATILKDVLMNTGISDEGLILDESRPTTSKTRVIADSHHLLRIDSESKKEIDKNIITQILNKIENLKNEFEIIVLQDYNKGVLTKSSIKEILDFAKKNNKKILVDPKFYNFFEYKSVHIFKPNRKEIEDVYGRKPNTHKELTEMGKELIKDIGCENLVLTLGNKGMMIFENKNGQVDVSSINTRARMVSDVSGAGDTVISTIAVCLAGGAAVKDAVEISNYAAGIVVEEVGIVPIEKNTLIEQIKFNYNN